MKLLNFWSRRNGLVEADPSRRAAVATSVEPELLTPEQRADLDSARAELLQLAAKVGVKSLRACPRDGSRWQDNPAAIRAISAVLREESLGEPFPPEEGEQGR